MVVVFSPPPPYHNLYINRVILAITQVSEMNWFVFIVMTLIFIPILFTVDWDDKKDPRLDEMWMYEDDVEEAE